MPEQRFESERHGTDTNLDAERTKAVDSLNEASLKTRARTDAILKDERSIADERTATARARHDMKVSNTAQLTEERQRTDDATEEARSHIDEVLQAERTQASAVITRVLEQEQVATDRSLLAERNATDAECASSSDLLKAEVQRHETTKVALTSREEFLAIVSHDLRNPIGAVMSYADLILEDGTADSLPREVEGFVRTIRRNADLALRLISDLLDVERIAQGKLELNVGVSDVRELLSQTVESFAPQAQDSGIFLSADLPSEKLEVECDHDRILQVLSNLTSNALKYTPGGGSVRLGVSKRAGATEFSVTDTGPGVATEKQKEIFERFAQLRSNNRTGLGLGLYISRTLVEAHDGFMSVESDAGRGATFRFDIPRPTMEL